uniref:Putative complement component 1, q subcomponent protein n=1 Tax=Procambarus clarkii TaxID=6728 RepID=A0A1Z3GD26_PROCL|nr:putative complement component 1, q subcomponent protein [Procambarus clarkii]
MKSLVTCVILALVTGVIEAQSPFSTPVASDATTTDATTTDATVTTLVNATLQKYVSINATIVISEGSDKSTVEARQLYGPSLQSAYFPAPLRPVAFTVRKATETLYAFAHLHFRDVLTNIGNAWDPDTSEFIAPYHGGYFFQFHAVGGRNSDFTVALTKNTVYQVTAYGTRQSFEHGSNSVFLELRSMDRVSLELQQGAIYEHPGNEAYTTFTGFLLFPL